MRFRHRDDKRINSVLLADDDEDDCTLFKQALPKQPAVQLTMVHDGDELMELLRGAADDFPDILFLDLNMPRKNGMESLVEIKENGKWNDMVVIIYSTSLQDAVADQLYDNGADYFLQKPSDFDRLKLALDFTLSMLQRCLVENRPVHPSREKFRYFLNAIATS